MNKFIAQVYYEFFIDVTSNLYQPRSIYPITKAVNMKHNNLITKCKTNEESLQWKSILGI